MFVIFALLFALVWSWFLTWGGLVRLCLEFLGWVNNVFRFGLWICLLAVCFVFGGLPFWVS